ncbi:1980_t:CDS:2 [Dentiscutata erythropus]|uniref:1980_t:CDS:1 n=1 Tax=Dentiscutata erythropus TaxID=1348616 RepID=A0A9N9NMB7_9GLOM|nr:1980_t:CDS:2 [Dentiscutata erythropus]
MQNDNQNKYEFVKKETKGVVEIKHLATNEVTHKKFRQKVPGAYCAKLIDPITELLLAEIQGDSSKAKLKKILLYQPDDSVELKDSGIFSFEQKFRWENEKFVWKKKAFSKDLECKIVQSGEEPNICIALYQPKNKKGGIVNIMSDNMTRINIQDRRGLEYVLLMSILSFLDKSDDSISKEKNEFILGEESKGELKEELKKLENKEKQKREREKKKSEKQNERIIKELTEADKAQKLKQEKMDEELARKLAEEQKNSTRPAGNHSRQRSNSFSSSSPSAYTPPSSGSNRTTYHDDNTFQSRKQKLAKHKPKEYTNEYGW